MRTFRDAKAMAKAMREALGIKGLTVSHSEALEVVARQFGTESWNVLAAKIESEEADGQERAAHGAEPAIAFTQPVPILRIFDEDKAREFYVGWLGMEIDWEHRFAPQMPLYCQVSLGGMKLHLSEHSGDASPGATCLVYMEGVEAWQKQLVGKPYKYNRPGLERQDWGLECTVIDPFGNRIRFLEARTGD
ncbi:glyoxalase superfamily protein [Arvimicrobium flavum]|uniref:glyoxalase superfamily protein n=1 Tax=Arvimicrobium flavum TaxID=3393320 RepID=UPI00237BE155|nr:glyoxalase superfamily protein [Mesorhizobium shangrilense]